MTAVSSITNVKQRAAADSNPILDTPASALTQGLRAKSRRGPGHDAHDTTQRAPKSRKTNPWAPPAPTVGRRHLSSAHRLHRSAQLRSGSLASCEPGEETLDPQLSHDWVKATVEELAGLQFERDR